LHEKGIELKLFGNEVYYINSLTSLVKNMLCSKLHYQIFLNLIPVSHKTCPRCMSGEAFAATLHFGSAPAAAHACEELVGTSSIY